MKNVTVTRWLNASGVRALCCAAVYIVGVRTLNIHLLISAPRRLRFEPRKHPVLHYLDTEAHPARLLAK